MLDQYLIQLCDLVSTTRNEYGDYIDSDYAISIPCRFRDIQTMKQGNNQELNDSDAMLWVAANSGVVRGSIIRFEGFTYQVERITPARRLGEETIQFLKCDLKVTDIGIS